MDHHRWNSRIDKCCGLRLNKDINICLWRALFGHDVTEEWYTRITQQLQGTKDLGSRSGIGDGARSLYISMVNSVLVKLQGFTSNGSGSIFAGCNFLTLNFVSRFNIPRFYAIVKLNSFKPNCVCTLHLHI